MFLSFGILSCYLSCSPLATQENRKNTRQQPYKRDQQKPQESRSHRNAQARNPLVKKIGPIGITVSSLRTALPFYTEVLSFRKLWISEVYGAPWDTLQGIFSVRIRTARLQLGEEMIELNEYLTPGGRPIPPDSRTNDLWFQHIAIVVSDMEKAYQKLRKNNIRYISSRPQTIPSWNKAAAGIKAFYFRDPDGHPLELIYFPRGKGNSRWQNNKKDLFLGIDHTAIAVSQTEKSLFFYKELLGLQFIGGSLNYGVEQSHLNHVQNARVKITSLKAKGGGPGVEFLQYISPGAGKPYPPNTRSDDLWHWQTVLFTNQVDSLYKRLKRNQTVIVSPKKALLNQTKRSYREGFLARDPDGHGLLIIQQ